MKATRWGAIGALAMFFAVAIGAFGAHALKDQLSGQPLRWWETAASYHAYHALGLLVLGVLPTRRRNIVGGCFLAGIVLFSGSLYAMALSNEKWLGAVVPLGGTLWLVGWGVLAHGLFREERV